MRLAIRVEKVDVGLCPFVWGNFGQNSAILNIEIEIDVLRRAKKVRGAFSTKHESNSGLGGGVVRSVLIASLRLARGSLTFPLANGEKELLAFSQNPHISLVSIDRLQVFVGRQDFLQVLNFLEVEF